MSWGEEQRKRQARQRAKLAKDAEALLVMIKAAIIEKGHTADILEGGGFEAWWKGNSAEREKAPLLKVDGCAIALKMAQHHTSGTGGGLGYHHTDRLAVKVDWIWDARDHHRVVLKAKSFGHAKSRPKSFGFDVAKIVEYILYWREQLLKTRERAGVREDSLKQWEAARKRIIETFDVKNIGIQATPGGLKISLTTDERRLEAILEAGGYERRAK